MSLPEHDGGYLFKTHLKALPEVFFGGSLRSSTDEISSAYLKKRARHEISLDYTSENLGFLHACMIKVGGLFYLLAGPSKVGKSTYAESLAQSLGAEVVASDWVAVEKEDDIFFASDLNFAENLRHHDRCPLAGIIFLTHMDAAERDAFTPNFDEYYQLLSSTFDEANLEQAAVLSKFWLRHKNELPLCYAVPTRQNGQEYVSQTLVSLLHRAQTLPEEVGVIGLGALGSQLAFQLGQLESVTKVHLYNRTPDKTTGYALDMNQAVPEKGSQVFVPHYQSAEVFMQASVVFMCFRDQNTPQAVTVHERWQKVAGHIKIMRDYAAEASETHFLGTIFILTNPMDILTYALYYFSQAEINALRTYQIYGLGLELDVARQAYYAREEGFEIDHSETIAYGNHSDEFVLSAQVSAEDHERIFDKVKNASRDIRKYIPRTIFGPVAAAKKSFLAFQNNSTTSLALLQKKTFLGETIQFRNGLPLFLSSNTDEVYEGILNQNKENSKWG